jgi:hypothetical protein
VIYFEHKKYFGDQKLFLSIGWADRKVFFKKRKAGMLKSAFGKGI